MTTVGFPGSRASRWRCGAGAASAALLAAVALPGAARAQVPRWTQLMPATHPTVREGAAMAYDSVRGVTVLFGGRDSSTFPATYFGETWEWTGTVWTQRAPAHSPSGRAYHTMAYDSERRSTVLYGGQVLGGLPLSGQTWTWDGTDWTLRSASAPGVLVRGFQAMAYDGARSKTVLFGGQTAVGVLLAGTFLWDGTAWTEAPPPQPPQVASPPVRNSSAMAFDSGRARVVLFGGVNNGVYAGDTWEWDGIGWTQRVVAGPSGRSEVGLAYDTLRGVTALFGGSAEEGGVLGETWEWSGTAWIQRAIAGPSARTAHAMAYDRTRHVTVLFGGIVSGGTDDAQTWTLGPTCVGDMDHNGRVDPADVSLFMNTWFGGVTQGTLAGDFDGNGVVQPADVSLFVQVWFAGLTSGC